MLCVDNPRELNLSSNRQTQISLSMELARCSGEGCALPNEIDQLLANHRILFLHNQQTYLPYHFDEEPPIKKRLVENYVSLTQSHTYSLQKQTVESAESFVSILSANAESTFFNLKTDTMPAPLLP